MERTERALRRTLAPPGSSLFEKLAILGVASPRKGDCAGAGGGISSELPPAVSDLVETVESEPAALPFPPMGSIIMSSFLPRTPFMANRKRESRRTKFFANALRPRSLLPELVLLSLLVLVLWSEPVDLLVLKVESFDRFAAGIVEVEALLSLPASLSLSLLGCGTSKLEADVSVSLIRIPTASRRAWAIFSRAILRSTGCQRPVLGSFLRKRPPAFMMSS
mmetsp:Transcript_400/g.964  ORF Transcript_400/g.964 Transcript_400/m.964 type:complete len:221 (-) Transcript_400:424-1086(-)